MVGIYFSGSGNSRYAVELFCNEYDEAAKAFSIEDDNVIEVVKGDEMLVFAYPVQYSTVPKILRDFIIDNKELWKNKKVFVIATMGLFSGDGAGILGRLLQQYGAGQRNPYQYRGCGSVSVPSEPYDNRGNRHRKGPGGSYLLCKEPLV